MANGKQVKECILGKMKTKYSKKSNSMIHKFWNKHRGMKSPKDKMPKEYCFVISFSERCDSEIRLTSDYIENEPQEKHFVTDHITYYETKKDIAISYVYSTHIEGSMVCQYSDTLQDKEDIIVLYRQGEEDKEREEKEILIKMIATMKSLLSNYQDVAEEEHGEGLNRARLNKRIRAINNLYIDLDDYAKSILEKGKFVKV